MLAVTLLASAAAADDVERAEPWEFRSQWGWYQGDRVTFYDLGRAGNTTSPVYRLVDGTGEPVEGQHLIFADLRPGILVGVPPSGDYSDFHRVWDVQVPEGYVPDTHRSLSDLLGAELPMTETDQVMNTPIVPANSTLVGTDVDLHPLMTGWWEGVAVHFFTFETSEDTPGLFDPSTGLVMNTSSMSVFDPPGQLDMLYSYPGDAIYSPLSRQYIFNPISTEYVADEVRSWEEAVALGFSIFPEGNMYNRPVVGGREAYPRFEHPEPSVYELKEAWSGRTSRVLYYDMGPLVPGQVAIYRFVTEEGAPILRQHDLVEVVAPGVLLGDVETEGYSTTWRFYDVVVEDEAAFELDVIKSMEDVRSMGFTINETNELMIAPMITRDAVFKPLPSNPPGEGLMMAWYRGAPVYLNVLDPDGTAIEGAGMPQDNEGSWSFRTVNLIRILDTTGTPYPEEKPILETLPTDEANFTVTWSMVDAWDGEGYRQGRFRTREQLEERGWSFNTTGSIRLGGFVAGPINVPAWKPERFTFVVGPVVDEDGKLLKGVEVRISRGIEVVQGRTGADGKVSFEVNSTWNDETVQTYLSKEGYLNSNFPAEIRDYERYIPLGGYVPPMVSEDDGGGLEGMGTFALVGVLVVLLFVVVLLVKGRSGDVPSISDREADEIFSEGDGDRDGHVPGDEEDATGDDVSDEDGAHLTVEDVEEIEAGPERLS